MLYLHVRCLSFSQLYLCCHTSLHGPKPNVALSSRQKASSGLNSSGINFKQTSCWSYKSTHILYSVSGDSSKRMTTNSLVSLARNSAIPHNGFSWRDFYSTLTTQSHFDYNRTQHALVITIHVPSCDVFSVTYELRPKKQLTTWISRLLWDKYKKLDTSPLMRQV
jgi:hypothetical protein